MESNYFDIEDKKGVIHEDTLKIKLFKEKEQSNAENTLQKNNFTKNNISLFSNETNERTIFRAIQNINSQQDTIQNNINTNYIDNINNINNINNNNNNNNNQISTIKIENLPSISLPPSDSKELINPIILPNSCLSTISSLGTIYIYDKFDNLSNMPNLSSYIDQPNIISPLYININFFPEIEYNPVPEKEYYDDILSELLVEEDENAAYKKCIYIEFQKNLDNKRRAELISFIYKMAKVYMFKNRTIFLAVQTMDRFFCKEKIDPQYYDLLCICSLVIACKFNEIYYPAFKDIMGLFVKEKNYSVKQAITMELLILKTINYSLCPIFPMYFFDIIAQKSELNNIEYFLGSLMIELIQFDFYLYPFKNSILAQTVFCKVVNLTKRLKNPMEILKNIFPSEENLELYKENINQIGKASIVIDELLHNLNAEYFVDIYQWYRQPDVLGSSINYFLNM